MTMYFAYGANLNLEDMQYRCPDARPVGALYLKDWRLVFSGVATIVPSPGNCVAGALWVLTEECEKSLDQFEGYPHLYTKQYLTQDGRDFMVYVMNKIYPSPPSITYYDTIKEGYRDWKLDQEYLDRAVADSISLV